MLGSTLRSEPRRRSRGRHRSKWTPHRLSGLRAWYDAELGQPKYMGAGAYVQLNGASTDNISTPDSATNSFSNDIEVITRVYCNDWTAASTQTVGGKYISSGNQRSWRFYVNSAGNVGLSASVDGTAVITVTVTPTVALVNATWFWLRLRLDLTDGANSVGYVDIADDTGSNYILPSSWTANGTATGSIISGLFDSTSPIEFGAFANGTLERFSGRVGRYIVRSGFDGTTVADFNASDCYGDGYWHEDGYRWTLGLPKIYDVSGNGVAPATFGAGTNQPKWLPWTGAASVHLEAASAGTNSISCTAPAGAVSYVARHRDYPNVADATGAASAGAFTFTTAGQWQYISILDGSAAEIARFDAALCSQSGMTDSYSVAWTINRGTAGRKTVVQSPAAVDSASSVLLGTDDVVIGPAAAVPSAPSEWSIVWVGRRHESADDWAMLMSTGNNAASTSEGAAIFDFGSGTDQLSAMAHDGSGVNSFNSFPQDTDRSKQTVATLTGNASDLTFQVNGDPQVTVPAPGGVVNMTTLLIGRATDGGYSDQQWRAAVIVDRTLTETEHGRLVAYYNGGV